MREFKKTLTYTLIRWISVLFVTNALIFCAALLPALSYLKDTFTTLQLEKSNQQMKSGAESIDQAVNLLINASQTIASDSRFRTLRYAQVDYDKIAYNTKGQLKAAFEGLMAGQDIAVDAALEFEQDTAIVLGDIFWRGNSLYYPDFFCVGDMSFEEWREMLQENKYGFLPVQTIRHPKSHKEEYDALIYAVQWSKSAYMYACFDMEQVKEMFISDEEKEGCYLTITCAKDGTVLYSDLPEKESITQTISTHLTAGDIDVQVHIGESVFGEKMHPMYFWIMLYCVACVMIEVAVVGIGMYFSVHPLRGLLDVLDKYRNPKGSFAPRKEFDQISDSLLHVEQSLGSYKETISVQQKILRAKYMEKALNAQLISREDIVQFRSCFPEFPEQGFYLMYARLRIQKDKQNAGYEEPLALISMFLDMEMSEDIYHHQQLSDTELLLVIQEAFFESCKRKIDFLIDNINREEEGYELRCFASNLQQCLENIPVAYLHVKNMEGFFFEKGHKQVCIMEEGFDSPEPKISVSTFMLFYTAISYGNKDTALEWLKAYSDDLVIAQNTLINRYAFEMLRAILNCIKMEQIEILAEQTIPVYGAYRKLEMEETLYTLLADTVSIFCDRIGDKMGMDVDSFGRELVGYVDDHFRDPELCVTALAEHFGCSASTIRNAFKENTNITIAAYIEQKRMTYANTLLAQKQKTIAEVAVESGFSSSNSFYKAYRRVYGHAPSAKELK